MFGNNICNGFKIMGQADFNSLSGMIIFIVKTCGFAYIMQ